MQLWRWIASAVQQLSAALCIGDRTRGGCRISRELLAVFTFMECNSPKQKLAQNRVSSTLGRNAVKPFLFPNSQQISLSYTRHRWMESVSVFYSRNQWHISNYISYFGNGFLNCWSGHGWFKWNLISFSHIKRPINSCEIELNQAVWNLMCSNQLWFLFQFGFGGAFL